MDLTNTVTISGIFEKDEDDGYVLRLTRQKDAITPVTGDNLTPFDNFCGKHVILNGKFISKDMKDGTCLSSLIAEGLDLSEREINCIHLTIIPVTAPERIETRGGGFISQRARLADGNGYITVTSGEDLGLTIGESYNVCGRIKAKAYKKYSSLSLQIKGMTD